MYICLEIIILELDNNKKVWNSREMIVLIFTNSQKLIHALSSSLILTFWEIYRNFRQYFMCFSYSQKFLDIPNTFFKTVWEIIGVPSNSQ